jgi:hypothetical protein
MVRWLSRVEREVILKDFMTFERLYLFFYLIFDFEHVVGNQMIAKFILDSLFGINDSF